jgi:BirA family transcriptional regulator, biotin operon repressor / biotin---[acetyl-CoA-carboxylase] ligase
VRSSPVTHRFEALPSTQDTLHQLAQTGAPAGTAVVAREQTLGRGSRGREWHSPAGGLWLSVLCRPPEELAMEVLSLRVALAVSAALERACPGIALQIKWPNDLMLAGRKLGGILCEARWQGGRPGWVAAGLGLNVANPIPDPLADSAISLDTVSSGVTPEALTAALVLAITDAGQRHGLLAPMELELFRTRDWLLGRRLESPGRGEAHGLAEDGSLLILGEQGQILPFRTGTITLAAPPGHR